MERTAFLPLIAEHGLLITFFILVFHCKPRAGSWARGAVGAGDQKGGENEKAFTSANWRMKASQNPAERQFDRLASSFSLSEKRARVSVP